MNRNSVLGKLRLVEGDTFYRKLVENGNDSVVHSFIQNNEHTSMDLAHASMPSRGHIANQYQQLHASSINRISDTLLRAHQISQLKEELALDALEQSYVLNGCGYDGYNPTTVESSAKYTLPAARKLLALALITESKEEIRDAGFVLQGAYISSWHVDHNLAEAAAAKDIRRLSQQIDELKAAPGFDANAGYLGTTTRTIV